MKTSPYKSVILELFAKAHVLSISDIHKSIPKADFSTIFRNVEALLKEAKLKKIIIDADVSVYELVGKGNEHDHFVCIDCGKIDEIHILHTDIRVAKKAKTLDIIVRGICGPCNK